VPAKILDHDWHADAITQSRAVKTSHVLVQFLLLQKLAVQIQHFARSETKVSRQAWGIQLVFYSVSSGCAVKMGWLCDWMPQIDQDTASVLLQFYGINLGQVHNYVFTKQETNRERFQIGWGANECEPKLVVNK